MDHPRFRTSESETIGQISFHGLPEGVTLALRRDAELVVVSFKSLIASRQG